MCILAACDFNGQIQVEYVDRFEFYERAKKCYAVVATG